MSVRNLEELIDENHAIVSSSVGTEYYIRILSFVDKDQLELEFAILMPNKVSFAGLMIMVWSHDLGLVKIFTI
uniref:Proteasomal ATPase second OB domain-containing protein n=1 Tax=Musa acuminata subsp. malaccensis TaxID=214687 RepID=A0A804HWQ0_MUSAM